jgi:hypothetical protein
MKAIMRWMHGRSDTYSRLCEGEMTRWDVIYWHLVFVLVGTAAIAAEESFMVTAVCAAVAGWMVYRRR